MESTNNRGLSTMGWLLTGAALVILLIIALPLLGLGNSNILNLNPNQGQERALGESAENSPSPSSSASPSPTPTSSPSDVINNPNNYVGRQVTVSGEVKNYTSRNLFTVGPEGFGLMNKELLVISAQPVATPVPNNGNNQNKNQLVRVVGTIENLNANTIQNQLGVTLDQSTLKQYNGKPVLIANQVQWQNETNSNQSPY